MTTSTDRLSSILLLCGLWLPALACGGSDTVEAAGTDAAPAARRSDDPRIVAAREALDRGYLDRAEVLLDQIGDAGGLEGELLAARAAALGDDEIEATRRVEAARRIDAADPRVYATASEVAAVFGRFETAEQEFQRGLTACGATPELQRARGIYLICVPGGARAGLAELEAARKRDPSLPFLGRALGQAHLLVGKREMADGDPVAALKHAQSSLRFDPDDTDGRRFFGECHIANGGLGHAIRVYEELVAEGEPMGLELAMLYKNHAMAALLQDRDQLSLDSFRRARELGLTPEELGTGRHVLERESERLVAEAGEAFRAEDPVRARELLESAVACDPDSVMAHYVLGIALLQLRDAAGAANEWSWVIDTAALEDLELPDPVHVNLSRALELDGRFQEARDALEDYLAREPMGRWRDATLDRLAELDAPAAK